MSEGRQAGVGGFRQVDDVVWELPASARADMRVPARVFADRELIGEISADRSLEQLANVATLPGITGAALAMPDIHQGYGFPVGGVAATELPDGVVSPGGVGYDINCGVRLLALPLTVWELGGRTEALVHELSRRVPVGAGHGGALKLTGAAFDHVLTAGPRTLLAGHGIGTEEDIEHTESDGCLPGADPAMVSERARVRGCDQLGTLGSGNHFLEVQRVAKILDPRAAEKFGLRLDQVTVLIHSGSRGFGHQVCTDYVRAGCRVGPLPDHPPGQAVGLRAVELAGGAALLGGDGVRGELRVGQSGGARPSRARVGRADPWAEGRTGNASGL